ncbi:MAG TPA: TRAP transporter substrate-binding protein DctP [Polyangia bacterium]|nr:TRAP transporter substrate-binding protein DctP [Polyangia bacterium]
MRRSGGLLGAAALAGAMTIAAATSGHADPVTLRMAAIAPDGTEWARALKAYANEVETASKGELRMKWYLGGMAGDELAALDRVKRGQLDGEAGAIFCQRLAPTLRVARVPGMFESRDEFNYLMGRLKPTLDEEFRKSGFTNLGETVFGIDVLFSRTPIKSLDELLAARMWAWNLDPVWQGAADAMGMKTIVTTIEEHSEAWRHKSYDAFFCVPGAALAYQWTTETSYVAELGATALPACLVVSNAAIDPLPNELKQVLITTSAKFMNRFNAVSEHLDQSLVNGLLERQGLTKVQVSPQFRARFNEAAKAATHKMGAALIAPGTIETAEKMLSEYRAAHRLEAAKR